MANFSSRKVPGDFGTEFDPTGSICRGRVNRNWHGPKTPPVARCFISLSSLFCAVPVLASQNACSVSGQTQCSDNDCGDGDERYDGVCNKDGFDFNSWRWGNQDFLGPGKTVDTSQPLTVVTQFITSENTTIGTLSEIRRICVQNGKAIQNSDINIAGISPPVNLITNSFYAAQTGGLKAMGAALQKGMVLALSIWDDHEADMLWLDSNYSTDADPSVPGVSRGPCSTTSGDPKTVESTEASNYVVFSDIKFGAIGSTFSWTGSGTGTGSDGSTSTTPAGSAPTGGSLAQYSQCGGTGWTGRGSCVAGTTCTILNSFYSQCL
ncbi:concanavalin A-like lectin/glucanase domain-containing protein [Mycena vulgaris]|nr:concanavalin A-like lectin/glucanase domain-containing protein [Mycena vulgaris]